MRKIFYTIVISVIALTAAAQNELVNNGSVLQINTGAVLQVNGSFTNNATSSLVNDGTLTVTGNITNNQVMATPNAGTLQFNGTVAQALNGAATYFAENVAINNAAGVTLNTALRVDGMFNFTNGKIAAATSTTPVIFTSNASHTGANNNSYVNGFVVKEGTGVFSFPIGNALNYQKVDVNLTANNTGMQARYSATDAGTGTFTSTGTETTPLVSYNTNEFWDITPLSTATGTVTIFWDGVNDVFPNAVAQRKVAHKVGANWLNEGTVGTGTAAAGSVTSNSISTWSPFALGSTVAVLPVRWLNVTASLNATKQALIGFSVNENNVIQYSIEKSNDAQNFTAIGTLSSRGNGVHSYQFTENNTLQNTSYYRVKQTSVNGGISYSAIVKLSATNNNNMSVFPNPVSTMTTVSGETVGATLQLVDVTGRLLQNIKVTNPTFTVDMSGYSKGLYLLQGNNQVIKIIKE